VAVEQTGRELVDERLSIDHFLGRHRTSDGKEIRHEFSP
jgi:hypothetical protein